MGCTIAVLIWFLILLIPCFLINLAVQQEITISTGDAPGQMTRLWLISEADQRGLGLSTASVHQTDPNDLCVQTNVRFILWMGHSDPTLYCDCYQRASADVSWSMTTTTPSECSS